MSIIGHSHMYRRTFTQVSQDIHTRITGHSHMYRRTFAQVLCDIRTNIKGHSHMYRRTFTQVSRTFTHVSQDIHTSIMWHSHKYQGTYTHVSQDIHTSITDIHTCIAGHSLKYYVTFAQVSQDIHTSITWHSHKYHVTFTKVSCSVQTSITVSCWQQNGVACQYLINLVLFTCVNQRFSQNVPSMFWRLNEAAFLCEIQRAPLPVNMSPIRSRHKQDGMQQLMTARFWCGMLLEMKGWTRVVLSNAARILLSLFIYPAFRTPLSLETRMLFRTPPLLRTRLPSRSITPFRLSGVGSLHSGYIDGLPRSAQHQKFSISW